MVENCDLIGLADEIERDFEGILTRWMTATAGWSWNLKSSELKTNELPFEPMSPKLPLLNNDTQRAITHGVDTRALVRERCRHFLSVLEGALASASSLEITAPEFREAIRYLSFTAGWMAGMGFSITDAMALIFGLKETLKWDREKFFQSLLTLVGEAYMSSINQQAAARFRDIMEKSQLVCELNPRLPALFLLGNPDKTAVDDAASRLIMLAVMREVKTVIVDISGLLDPSKIFPYAYQIFSEHDQMAGIKAFFSGVTPAIAERLEHGINPSLPIHETLAETMGIISKEHDLSWPV